MVFESELYSHYEIKYHQITEYHSFNFSIKMFRRVDWSSFMLKFPGIMHPKVHNCMEYMQNYAMHTYMQNAYISQTGLAIFKNVIGASQFYWLNGVKRPHV